MAVLKQVALARIPNTADKSQVLSNPAIFFLSFQSLVWEQSLQLNEEIITERPEQSWTLHLSLLGEFSSQFPTVFSLWCKNGEQKKSEFGNLG